MTDEIKAIKERLMFRVWDEHKKSYRDDYDIQKDGQVTLRGMFNGFDITKHPDSFTIEQCTGIRDKNGKLVFEGDVIHYHIETDSGEVIEENFAMNWYPDCMGFDAWQEADVIESDGEVIGTIHDMEDYK